MGHVESEKEAGESMAQRRHRVVPCRTVPVCDDDMANDHRTVVGSLELQCVVAWSQFCELESAVDCCILGFLHQIRADYADLHVHKWAVGVACQHVTAQHGARKGGEVHVPLGIAAGQDDAHDSRG